MPALDSEKSMFYVLQRWPRRAPPDQSSQNGIIENDHVATNGLGGDKRRVLEADEDTPMSDIDVPLVSALDQHYPVSTKFNLHDLLSLSQRSRITRSTDALAPSNRMRCPTPKLDSRDDDDQPFALISSRTFPPKQLRQR